MLDFHIPTAEDRVWMNEVLTKSRHQGCLYTFAQMALWSARYNTRVCRVGNAVCGLAGTEKLYYTYPAGEYDTEEIIGILLQDAQERGTPFRLSAVEEWQKDELMSVFGDRFCAIESRNDFDYIYRAEDLANLAGRKYHSKRNHIAKFTRSHPDWRCEEINEENIPDCLALAEIWFSQGEPDEDLLLEHEIIKRALADMNGFGLEGLLLRVGNEPAAFAIGEPLGADIYDIHFEKAIQKYAEGYAVINREYARWLLGRYEFINREEDLGIEGLRRAKLSYAPAVLLKKYLITECRKD